MTKRVSSNIFKNLKKKYKIKSIVNNGPKFLFKPIHNSSLIQKFLSYYNQAEKHKWVNQPWYYGTGLHYSTTCNILPVTKQVCGGSFNNPDYENTMLFDQPVVDSLLENIEYFPLVRCKITTIQHNVPINSARDKNLWHKDETPFEVLRVIIPLETSDEYLFQLDNHAPVNLKVGMVYAFDQNIYHRVYKEDNTSVVDRTHLILSYVTWFTKDNGEWIPNEFTGKIHPLEIFDNYINL